MSKIHQDDPNEKSKEHDATVFFPIPDGTAKIYKVLGTALPPSAQQTIEATATVREWTTIKLTITNWLYQTQRFHVSWGKTEQGIFIKGANTIDVSSNSSKEYKLSFKSLKETPYNFKITFENVDNKEYIFYIINVTMTPAKTFKEVELVGQVRDIVTGSFTINNPLNTDVTIPQEQIIIENEYLTLSPDIITIPAESEVTIDVSFRPLIVGKISTNVTIKSAELGELKYPISIEGTPAPPQTLQPIQASLGSDKIIQVSFTHFIKKPTTYTIKVEQYSEGVPFSDFIPEVNNITVDLSKGGQAENSFNLRYEPSNVVESKGLLKASSPDGGEYQWIITGKPSFPQAQGPFKVPPGKSYNLEFKNPLNEAVEVNVRFDNPNFSAGKVNNKIEAKKVMNVPIAYKQISNEFGNTGRCIVTINKLPPWVYYLSAE
jgi:hydrocephalus-inducing protein